MKTALRYLKTHEWIVGHGQCPKCFGCKPRRGWWTEMVGHKAGCALAMAIRSLGGNVTWERTNHSKKRFRLEKTLDRILNKNQSSTTAQP